MLYFPFLFTSWSRRSYSKGLHTHHFMAFKQYEVAHHLQHSVTDQPFKTVFSSYMALFLIQEGQVENTKWQGHERLYLLYPLHIELTVVQTIHVLRNGWLCSSTVLCFRLLLSSWEWDQATHKHAVECVYRHISHICIYHR